MEPTAVRLVFPRQSSQAAGSSSGYSDGSGSGGSSDEFLNLIASPFNSQFSSSSFLSALLFSLVLTALITIGFCFIRPYNNVVYAPRAKTADSKHAPPPVDKGLFGWIKTILRTKEPELVEKVGLDAAVFMRFTRMMRNIFTSLTIVGCAILIPVTLVNSSSKSAFFDRLTPVSFFNSPAAWAYVVVSYLFDGIIFYFLWANYRHIVRLRRAYFDSPEYQKSLHARTILLTDIPANLRTDDGIVKITEEVKATGDTPRPAIARNVRDLPELVEEHEKAVRDLEKYLAKYLKNPDKLPAQRPTCKVSKMDKSHPLGKEVDAIDYLTPRIKELEVQIKEVRLSVDSRNAMSYGFAIYESIPHAHSVAYVARKKGPEGTVIKPAPKPTDLIWKNLPMMKKQRDWKNFTGNLWTALLTIAWIAPNVLIAVFLSNLSHLALVWPAFQTTLHAHSTFWSLVQGIVSPAITTLFYYFLPAIFRKLVTNAGDVTRTGRERHVLVKLFSFFIVNNLVVFSLFSAVWGFAATLINAGNAGNSTWQAVQQHNPFAMIITTLVTVTPYWCSWLLQRNLGAAIDLSQLVRLTWGSISRRYLNPTPRELIELTAPQPFDYAAYYNYFCFYSAVALCFGGLQPLTLAITALYFWMDSFLKKYMIMYIFITKYESGGMFWNTVFDRVLIGTGLGNLVVAGLVATKGSSWYIMLACMVPLPILIVLFKIYCMRTFDDQIRYYNKGQALGEEALMSGSETKRRKGDKIAVRFGHPALYKPLMTPMVSARSQHLLKQVYTGRTSLDDTTRAGFSDVYMETMDSNKPGKSSNDAAPFEIVSDQQLSYEQWKNNPEFRDETGEFYSRPGTPGTMMSGPSRAGTFEDSPGYSHSRGHSRGYSQGHSHSRSISREVYSRGRTDSDFDITRVNEEYAGGMDYPRGYHQTPAMREQSPTAYGRGSSQDRLVSNAARIAQGTSVSRSSTPSAYGQMRMTPGEMTPYADSTPGEDTSYDYFRKPRGR